MGRRQQRETTWSRVWGQGAAAPTSPEGGSLERRRLQSWLSRLRSSLTPAGHAGPPAAPPPVAFFHLPPRKAPLQAGATNPRWSSLTPLQRGVCDLTALPYNRSGEIAAVPFRFGSSLRSNLGKRWEKLGGQRRLLLSPAVRSVRFPQWCDPLPPGCRREQLRWPLQPWDSEQLWTLGIHDGFSTWN